MKNSSNSVRGLFYLLRIALELDIGETLWKACVPEGMFFLNVANEF